MISNRDFELINTCVLCNEDLKIKYKNIKFGFSILYCKSCQLGILNRQIKRVSINKIYDGDYFNNYRNKVFKKSNLERVGKKRYLEIGMGTGDMLIRQLNSGEYGEGWGVDLDSRSFKKINDFVDKKVYLNLLVGDISRIELPKNYFDHIYLSHVIEHIHNPVEITEKLYLALKKGGVIKMTTPNFDSLTNIILKNKADYSCPNHLYFFTKRSWKVIFRKLKISNYKIKYNWGNTLANEIGRGKVFVKYLLTPLSILGEIVTQKFDNLEIEIWKS